MRHKIISILKLSYRLHFYYYIHRWKKNKSLDIAIAFFLLPIALCKIIFEAMFKRKSERYQYDLGIVAIIKNEAPYIAEWIAYHKMIGIEKIILYNNESEDNLKNVLSPFIEKGFVDLYDIKGKTRQTDAYNDAIRRYKYKIRYIATIDADEFIFPLKPTTDIKDVIKETFSKNKMIGGLALNWAVFGSSGYVDKPNGLVIESYINRAGNDFEKNYRIKSIVNPTKVAYYEHAHFPVYKHGYYAINLSGQKVDRAISNDIDFSLIRINHYLTKSKNEYIQKRMRGRAFSKNLRPESDFNIYDRNEVFDDSMSRYVNAVKQILAGSDE